MSTTKPIPFNIEISDKMYYKSKDLQVYDPAFYYGCKKLPRNIIGKKNIPTSEYIFANTKINDWNLSEWNVSSATCKKAQLLITQFWVETNMTSMKSLHNHNEEQTQPIINNNIENTLMCLPPIIELDDNEKFKAETGNIIEIETCGERHEDKIYFKCSDISKGFGMDNLNKNVTDTDKGYEENVDYTYFIRHNSPNRGAQANKNGVKTLYLKYEGVLRVLFVSRHKNATIFRKWATQKLFTIQMGTPEAKIKLGTDLLQITSKTYKAVFNTYATKFPCIYLLLLGKIKDLRETFKISTEVDDNSFVYKYGFSDDLGRRIGEHDAKYGKLPNVNIKLSTFHIIDPKYTSEAENDVREFASVFELKIDTDGYNELIVLNTKQHDILKHQYAYIGKNYAGATAEIQRQITELKEKLKDMEHEKSTLILTHQLAIQKEKHDTYIIQSKFDNLVQISSLKEENYKLQIQVLTK